MNLSSSRRNHCGKACDPRAVGWCGSCICVHPVYPQAGVCKPNPVPPNWPFFDTAALLNADPWGKYYQSVYGTLPAGGYPIYPSDLWLLYDEVLIKAKVTKVPKSSGDCPTNTLGKTYAPPKGQRYGINNKYSPPFLNWVWHPYPYKALATSTWQEVLHAADPFGDEHFGAWFMYAPGSGIYFNLGKTISFSEHADAYAHFGVKAGDLNEELSKAAAAQGYDSVQFLAHVDHVNYQCDTQNTGQAGLNYMGVEIVGVKLVGLYPCGTPAGAPAVIKAGWQGAKACTCDSKQQFLNCQGVPALSYSSKSLFLAV